MYIELTNEELGATMNCLVQVAKLPGCNLNEMKYLINLHDKIGEQIKSNIGEKSRAVGDQ
jgi:hypothetical protein